MARMYAGCSVMDSNNGAGIRVHRMTVADVEPIKSMRRGTVNNHRLELLDTRDATAQRCRAKGKRPSMRIAVAVALLTASTLAHAGAFVVADENFPDIRLHERGFGGFGGDLEPVRVCMDIQANQAMAEQAEPALIKAIATINRFRSLGDHTLAFGAATDLPSGQYDFESVLLHELMHNHGLAHPNHADEAGLPGAQSEGTRSADGPNNVFNQAAGVDGLHGSADDVRGDDINLHWYQKGVNNPGVLASIIDDSSYARVPGFLPGGHLFAANADRQVLAALGFVDAEAVAQQGVSPDEVQRHLHHDDVATIRFARAGLDGIQGTGDDYRTRLVYRGRALDPQGEACQIAVRFDNTTAFATSTLGSFRLSTALPNHWALYHTRMRFNPSVNWYFSPGPNTVITILSDLPDASLGLAPITVRVQVAKAPSNPIASHPLGTVEVRDGARHDPGTASCSFALTGTPAEIGECVLTPLRSGNKTLTAEYLGYAGFDGGIDTEVHTSSGTLVFSAITDTPDPSVAGTDVGFDWTLAPSVGQAAATGTVTVKEAPDCASAAIDPAHQCVLALPAHGCSIRFNTVGSKTLQLCYPGDGAHAAASANIAHAVIAGRTTTTTITGNLPNPAQPLAPVAVQVSVRESPDLGGSPSGVVQVLDGPASDPLTARCTVNLAGSASEIGSCTLKPLRAGTRTLGANYVAQNQWAASSASATQAVARFAIVRHQPASSRVQQGVHVTVDLDVSTYLGAPLPTGTITVGDGTDQCQILLPASECFWLGTTPGTRNLVASWPGDGNYPARSSAPVPHTVLPAAFPQLVSNPVSGANDSNGASGSGTQALSADGRYVVFASLAAQLVAGDSNAASDVFIRDQRSGLVRRISTSASDVEANGPSREPAISANGRFVAFSSLASNLVPGDTNNVVDVFVKDLSDGSIVRATLRSDGSQDDAGNDYFVDLAPSLSADGRYVAFMTEGQLSPLDTYPQNDIYVRDLQTGALDIVSSNSQDVVGDFRSAGSASISADGRYVAFASQAFNFAANDQNDTADVWRKDRLTRSLYFVSTNAAGAGGLDPTDASFSPSISADGRYVAFASYSEHLVPGDVNNNIDVFLKDTSTGAIERISVSAAGVGGINGSEAPAISGDGRYVAFRSTSSNLVTGDTNAVNDIFVKDRQTSAVTRINLDPVGAQAVGGASELPAISADGRFVSYQSAATNLVRFDGNGLVDVFVRDRQSTPSVRASAVNPGAGVDGASGEAGISGDGSIVVFSSAASTLVAGDTNAFTDIFARQLANGTYAAMSVAAGVTTPSANGASDSPNISSDGAWVVYRSFASNLVSGDGNGVADIFMKQRVGGAIERLSTSTAGAQLAGAALRAGTSISQDGNLVLFHAGDSNLVAGDSNGFDDVLMKNRSTGVTSVVSVKAGGGLSNGHNSQAQISDDGSHVVFVSTATDFVADDSNGVADVYVKLPGGTVLRASSDAGGVQGNGASGNPGIGGNGRLVVFTSAASNLVPGDSNAAVDVFVRDLQTGSIQRVSTDAGGAQGVGGDCSGSTSISGDGRYVGFSCAMSNLVIGDSNGLTDSFVKDLTTGAISRTSLGVDLAQANAASSIAARALSDNGLMVFSSAAGNVVPLHDADSHADVFISPFNTVPRVATSTVITSHNPNPSPRDGSYVVGVSVTRGSGSADVRGSVRISEGSAFCFASLSGAGTTATGQCTLQAFSTGGKTLNARYGGDQQYAASDAASVAHDVLPIVPFAPMIGTARAGNGEVQVYFTPPADNGGAVILSYTAQCGSITALGVSSPVVVSGLANDVAVACTVRATNSVGSGALSALSNSVTPSSAQTVVGPFAYVPRNNSGQMSVIDLGSNTVVNSINGGAGIGIAVAPNGLRAYAIDQGSSSVKVVSTVTQTQVASIAVGAGPWSGVTSPDSTRLYVSNRNANTVSVINTATNTVDASFNVPAAPTGLVLSPDGATLYVGSANTTMLSVVRLSDNQVNSVNVGTTSHALAINRDGSRVYFVNGQQAGRMVAFNTATLATAGDVVVGGVPIGIGISPDGSRVYVSNDGGNGNVNGNTVFQIDAATLSVIAVGATGPRPRGVDVHPDGTRVYVGNSNGTMSVLDTAGMTAVATLNLGSPDAIYAIGNFIARTTAPSLNRNLAVGAITLPATGAGANLASRVLFPQPFLATPVVIVQADDADADPKALRIANVSGSGFDLLQVEPRGCVGCTGAGGAMTVHWLAALPGSHRLPSQPSGAGVLIKVGSMPTMASQRAGSFGGFAGFPAQSWQSVVFPSVAGEHFSAPPVLLTGLQSWNPANVEGSFSLPPLPARPGLSGVSRLWFTTAVRDVSAVGFGMALESSSSDNTGAMRPGLYNPETIGYVAFETGVSTQLTVVGGSAVSLATATGTSSGAGCPATLMSFPASSIVTAANLRGFGGLHTRNEDDGGWLRRCALTNPSGSNVSIGLRVDEDADLNPDRTHPSTESIGAAVFGGEFTTTPVSLAFVHAQRLGEQIDVQFGSAAEAAHLGYRLWGRASSSDDWRALHADLIVNGEGDSMSGKAYRRVVHAPEVQEIRIEDIDVLGVSRFHPALALGADGRASMGASARTQPIDWTSIRASNLATSQGRGFAADATTVLAQVTRSGIQRLSFAQLNAAGFAAGVPLSELAVLEHDQPVPRHVECPAALFGPGCFVEWLGTTRPSLYGRERMYAITRSAPAARPVSSGAVVDAGAPARSFVAHIDHSPDRAYSMSAPGNDPWYDQRLVVTTAPAELSRSFDLPARAAGPVHLQVDLWGGLDYPGDAHAAADHSVELLLNGHVIARRRFDGLSALRVELTLSDAQLQDSNVLTLRLPADTGHAADVVLLDGFRLSYARNSVLSDGELVFGDFTSSAGTDGAVRQDALAGSAGVDRLMSDGFESRGGFSVTGITGTTTVWGELDGRITRDLIDRDAALDDRLTAAHIADAAHLQTPALQRAAAPQIDLAPSDYLIVTHPLFEDELQPLVTLQQSRGYRVKVLRTDAIYAARSAHQRSPQAIREVIDEIDPRFVLLVGGDSYDYDDHLELGAQSYLPTFYRASNAVARFAASDAPYADRNDDGIPERALGRIPARTVEEARRAIVAIVARGDMPVGRYFASAGISAASEHFDTHSRAFLSYLRQGQVIDFGLTDELGAAQAQATTLAALAGGSDWINYLGHSSPSRWAVDSLLDTTQLASIQRSGPAAIVSQWGCWSSYFVMPGQDSMSQALTLRPQPLAAAAIGSTSLVENTSQLALGTRLFDLIEDGRIDDRPGAEINTLGEALAAAKADLARRAPEHVDSNYSVTLFGDPAMRVR